MSLQNNYQDNLRKKKAVILLKLNTMSSKDTKYFRPTSVMYLHNSQHLLRPVICFESDSSLFVAVLPRTKSRQHCLHELHLPYFSMSAC